MSYIVGDRRQAEVFPASIEDYVKKEDPVRAYDAFVERLDLEEIGIEVDEKKIGAPAYEPRRR